MTIIRILYFIVLLALTTIRVCAEDSLMVKLDSMTHVNDSLIVKRINELSSSDRELRDLFIRKNTLLEVKAILRKKDDSR